MADFNFVTERVATGAAIATPSDVDQLVAAGVTHVIDCRGEFDDTAVLASHPDIHYLYCGVPDDGQPKPVEWFQKGIEFALDALSRPKYRVYSHCAAGINRGPSMCYAILLAQGIDPRTAENLIRTYRPQAGIAYKLDAQKAVIALEYVYYSPTPAFGKFIDKLS